VGAATATSGTTIIFKFDYEDVARKNRKTGKKQGQIEQGKTMTKVHGAATRWDYKNGAAASHFHELYANQNTNTGGSSRAVPHKA